MIPLEWLIFFWYGNRYFRCCLNKFIDSQRTVLRLYQLVLIYVVRTIHHFYYQFCLLLFLQATELSLFDKNETHLPKRTHICAYHTETCVAKCTPLTKSSVEIRMIFVKFLNAHLQQPAMIINAMQFHSVDKQYIPLPTDPRYAKPDLCRPVENEHDDVIKWKHFPHYWPFVRGIHRWPVKSPHKGQWHWAMIFSLICAWNKRLSKQS